MTYWMNNLQDLNIKRGFCQHWRFSNIEQDKVAEVIGYEHPVSPIHPWRARQSHALQGSDNTYYAGAHLGFGFHEDGLQSAPSDKVD